MHTLNFHRFLWSILSPSICIWSCLVLTTLAGSKNSGQCVTDPSSSCSCTTEDGKYTIDLTALQVENELPYFYNIEDPNSDTKYSYSPCGGFTQPTGASQAETECYNVAVCQNVDDKEYHNAGDTGGDFGGWVYNDSVHINYTTGNENLRKSTVYVQCGSGAGSLEFLGEDPELYYKFLLKTKYACFDGDDGLSTGSILIILLIVFVILYFSLGVAYMKFGRGAQGWEMIPNLEFWQDFPLLVRDGVVFTKNGCKVTDQSYEQI